MSETLAPAETPAVAPAPRRRRRPSWVKIVATVLLLAGLVLLPVPIGDQTGYLKLAQYVLIGVVGGIGLTLLVGQAPVLRSSQAGAPLLAPPASPVARRRSRWR